MKDLLWNVHEFKMGLKFVRNSIKYREYGYLGHYNYSCKSEITILPIKTHSNIMKTQRLTLINYDQFQSLPIQFQLWPTLIPILSS